MLRNTLHGLGLLAGVLAAGAATAQGRLALSLSDTEGLPAAITQSLGQYQPQMGLAGPATRRTPVEAPDYPEYPPVESDVYGQWLFAGHFARQSFTGFNPDYLIGPGDLIDLRFWGGFDYQATLEVDGQGQIFVARLGPIRVADVRNADLNQVLKARLRSVFREEVGVYAALASAQPVKVFVGGGVVRPGLYGATASDSILHFLDRAGGVSPEAGSYRQVRLLRGGRIVRELDLYDFLTKGQLPLIQLRDGDTLFVRPRGNTVQVEGLVAWPKRFEFFGNSNLQDVLALAQSTAAATHARVTRQSGARRETLVYPPDTDLSQISVVAGDQIEVYADRPFGTVLVRVTGEHEGDSQLVLPYGASLVDALDRVAPTPISDINSVRLFRPSVAARQKEVIEQLLSKLEESVLTARSDTAQEAALRAQEAQLILQFVERARDIEPKGQVVLQGAVRDARVILEEGDRLEIPRASYLVGVHGEVYLPAAFSWDKASSVADYIQLAGGFTQSGARDRVLLRHPNGAVEFARVGGWFGKTTVNPGDEILVLPRVDEKGFQLTKDVVEVIYQIAVAAGVLVRL